MTLKPSSRSIRPSRGALATLLVVAPLAFAVACNTSGRATNSRSEMKRSADPRIHLQLGRMYASENAYADALAQYLWCWDEGANARTFVTIRRRALLDELTALAGKYPPAAEAMRDRIAHPRTAYSDSSVNVSDMATDESRIASTDRNMQYQMTQERIDREALQQHLASLHTTGGPAN